MRRPALLLLLLAACIGGASTPAGAEPAAVAVADCVLSPGEEDRSAGFRARMRTVRGARRMAMRFTLLERVGPRRYTAVNVPSLRRWRYSRRNVDRFVFTQTVDGLRPGASYVMRVEFRWLAGGRVVASAQRRSGVCTEPGGPPNLRVGRVTARPVAGAPDEYTVQVHNDGGAEARDVAVVLIVDGTTLRQRAIPSIAPGSRAELTAPGPSCAREMRVVVDPHGTILESDEGDNVRTVGCPVPRR